MIRNIIFSNLVNVLTMFSIHCKTYLVNKSVTSLGKHDFLDEPQTFERKCI